MEENLICYCISVSIERMSGKGNVSAVEAENVYLHHYWATPSVSSSC